MSEQQIKTAPTKAFISYSWDDQEHRFWVRSLATRLRADGVDVTLDQWHAAPGDQLPAFMARSIRLSDYVLLICTPVYRSKADSQLGGVGYEGDIIQGQVFVNGDHRKFIPILRRGTWEESAPTTLFGKYYVDLRDSPGYEHNYRELLSTLLGRRDAPPDLGRPTGVTVNAEERLLTASTAETAVNATFVTNELDNDDFIFSSAPWPFECDNRGEDIKGKHTRKSVRDEIIPFRTFSSAYPTIAGNELIVGFFLTNRGPSSIFLEAITARILSVYSITASMFWNTWMPILQPHSYTIALSVARKIAEVDLGGCYFEILPGRVEHFRLQVEGDDSCVDRVVEFELQAEFHDPTGNRFDIRSDRKYHLGCRLKPRN
jgi:hypothetical protein